MGENCGFWFPQQQVNWQLSNLNSFTTPGPFPSGQGQENPVPLAMKPVSDVVSMNNTFPIDGCQENSNEPHGWFYCLPRFQQPFSPPLNSVLKEHPAAAREAAAREETINPNGDSRCGPQKRFLVFDQSGDQTTLIFNSGFGTTPVQCFTSKPPGIYNFVGENVVPKGDVNFQSRSNLVDVLDGSHKNDVQSEEMREDTEELNALLYSDDDDDTESIDGDDEVTSTGHSPSTMTSNEKQDWSEEVASSFEPITATISSRKRKLFDCNDEDDDTGYYDSNDVPSSSVKVTKGSVKVNPCQLGNDDDDDAESSCRDGCNQRLCVMGSSSSGMKRMRPEKIRETVNVLRKILPQGKRSKNAVVVIDEAIDYLKWLKLKAKAFGLHSTP